MRFVRLLPLLLVACEGGAQPDPLPDPSIDGGAPVVTDANAPAPPPNDAGIVEPIPFDAGTVPPPTCKGLFELCSGQECCSPNVCNNGTCR